MGSRKIVRIPDGYTDTEWTVQVNHKYYLLMKDSSGKLVKDPNSTLVAADWAQTFSDHIRDLKKNDIIKDAVWIVHDQDKNKSTGTHLHFGVQFETGKTQKDVQDLFALNNRDVDPRNVQPVDNWSKYMAYLTHESKEAKKDGKHIYDYKELRTTKPDQVLHDLYIDTLKSLDKNRKTPYNKYLEDIKVKNYARKKKLEKIDIEDKVNKLGAEVIAGKLTPNTAMEELQKDFPLVDTTRYLMDFNQFNQQFLKRTTKHMQDRKGYRNLYISGIADSGKSTMARALVEPYIDDFGRHDVSADSADFAGNYIGQRASVSDETSTTALSNTKIKSIFSPNHVPTVASRFFDKPYFPDISVHANSTPLGDWMSAVLWNSGSKFKLASADLQDFMSVQVLNNYHETKDQMLQLIRRFNEHIIIDPTGRKDEKTGKILGGVIHYFKFRYIKPIPLETWATPYDLIGEAYRCVGSIPYDLYEEPLEMKKELDRKAEDVRKLMEKYPTYTLDTALDNDKTGKLYKEYWTPDHSSGTDMVNEFWKELEQDFVWDLLPTAFLYDLFKSFSRKNNPSGAVLSKPAFTERLGFVIDDKLWENKMGRNTSQVRSKGLMDKAENLILEYDLFDWINHAGRNDSTKLNLIGIRKTKYRGLKRITKNWPTVEEIEEEDE